jgi:hypothetical protein
MNSIEAVNDPEKAKAQGKPAERPGPDAPPLRLFVKENDKYVLQFETADFQLAMKKAEQFYKKGQDILVNEKDNPLVVHAKSNLRNDVDVGREIMPSSSDGNYIQGRGKSEVLLATFYDKLPLNTEAFDKRQVTEATKGQAEAKPDDQAKGAAAVVKNGADKASAAVDAPASGVKLDKAAPEAPGQDAAATPNRKLILKKTGFELPEQILIAYVVKDGKYHDKTSDALRFQDHGKKLSTPVEDRAVIADMVAIAAAKNWDNIQLKGTDTFRQMAWLEAESHGIRTKGYEPSEHDRQLLNQLKRERGAGEDRIPDISKGEKDGKPGNSIEVSVDRAPETPAAKAERRNAPAPTAGTQVPKGDDKERESEPKLLQSQAGFYVGTTIMADGFEQPNARLSDYFNNRNGAQKFLSALQEAERAPDAGAGAAQDVNGAKRGGPLPTAEDRESPIVGRLVEHGRANFNHDKDEKPSYYVVLDTHTGQRTIWGKDLERSLAGSVHQTGDGLSLQLKGKEQVRVDANVRDDGGKVVGKETIGALRNEWEVKPVVVVLRALSADEKVRVDTASRVLEDTLSKYPDNLRREIIGKFAAAVEKGDMKLPTPQVAEKASQATPARQPEMERTR